MRPHQTVINMVAATVVVLLGVGAVYFTTMRTDADRVNTFDFASQLSLARSQAQSYTPVRPLPEEKWRVTTASFSRVQGETGVVVETWRVGVTLASGRFVWIEQVDGEITSAQQRWSRQGEVVGSVDVLGVPRQHWVSDGWRALTFADEGVALGIFGKANLDEMVELAQSLSGS